LPTITKPTRITYNTASLIDNIYIPVELAQKSRSGIIVTDISDHLPVFTFCGKGTRSPKENVTITYRPSSPTIDMQLNKRLTEENWNFLQNLPAEEGYTLFVNKLQDIIKAEAPIKTVTLSPKAIKHEPWLTKGILKSSRTQIKLYNKKIKEPHDNIRDNAYKTYRNMLNKIKRIAKKSYYKDQLLDCKNNIRETWKILNNLIGKQNDKSNIIEQIKTNHEIVSDPTKIANAFLQHFTTIGAKLANEIKPSKKSALSFMQDAAKHSMFLSPTDPMEIEQIINHLKGKKTAGVDGISTKLLKTIKHGIIKPISILINKSLEEGVCPDELKMTKIVPIFKS
jgi:hypothetical protein